MVHFGLAIPTADFYTVFPFLQYKKGKSDERFDEGFYYVVLSLAFMPGR